MERNLEDLPTKAKKKKFGLRPVALSALSFLVVILIGSILLIMPFSLQEGVSINYLDALFTAVSCTCVTGLSTVPLGVADTFSIAGRIIMTILMQLGGLGVTFVAVLIFVVFSKRLSLSQQSLIKENWNLISLKNIRRIFLFICVITAINELLGATLLFFDFLYLREMTPARAVMFALFHSVSAYNNAGFDLFGTTSYIGFQTDYLLIFTTIFLIISGGLGYFTVFEIIHKKFNWGKSSLQAKIVLVYTSVLIIVGTLGIYLMELSNSNTDISFVGSIFTSVTTRTAGFTLYDLSQFKKATLLLIMVFMYIGASPGGTGGGIKTTTFAIVAAYIRGLITDKKPHAFRRSVNKGLARTAMLIMTLSLSVFVFGMFLISLFEQGQSFDLIDIAFETMSAFATVGLSTGITTSLSIGSKITLIFLMYIGRLGPLTLANSIKSRKNQTYSYVEENVSIG
ncbi:MAG: H(+)-transporting ATPase [Bacilli bacterium]|nr:H(+)-transporting ATPase [Bacilli bacterium]